MTAPVEEIHEISLEDMPVLEESHIVCCEDVTKTFCGQVIEEEDYSDTEPEPISCAECLEAEQKHGVGACPSFAICAHAFCTPSRCNVRG